MEKNTQILQLHEMGLGLEVGDKNYFVFQMLGFNPLFVGCWKKKDTSHVVDVGAKKQCQEALTSILVTISHSRIILVRKSGNHVYLSDRQLGHFCTFPIQELMNYLITQPNPGFMWTNKNANKHISAKSKKRNQGTISLIENSLRLLKQIQIFLYH